MKPFLMLVVVLGAAHAAHAHSLHLDAPEASPEWMTKVRLIEDARPSFGLAVTCLTVGGILGTAGTGAAVTGVVFIALARGWLASLSQALGGILLGAGVGFIAIALRFILNGAWWLRDHNIANEQLDALRQENARREAGFTTMPLTTITQF